MFIDMNCQTTIDVVENIYARHRICNRIDKAVYFCLLLNHVWCAVNKYLKMVVNTKRF